MSKKLFMGAPDRNKGPLLEVLKKVIDEKFGKNRQLSVLEVGSGTGQHAAHFCKEIKELSWQPSDIDKNYLKSIEAFQVESQLPGFKPPFKLDICSFRDSSAYGKKYDILVSINMIHISPWKCTEELFTAAGELLSKDGILFMYGPYSIHGQIYPDSNVQFDLHLKSQNPSWGLRDIDDLEKEAHKYGLSFDAMFDMPANNKTLVWLKQ